jgi:single stranded DNA-binding protein
MSMYFQRVQVMGVTGVAPVLKILDTGPLAKFSICVEEWYRNQKGDSKRITTWFRCSAFGKVAEQVHKQVERGTWLFAEGRMRVKKADDGREYFSITVDTFRKLEQQTKRIRDEQPMPDYEGERGHHIIGAHD